MKRRQFITLLGGAAVTWPYPARAQQAERVRRIGVLMPLSANDPDAQVRVQHAAVPVIGFLRSAPLADVPHWVTAFRKV